MHEEGKSYHQNKPEQPVGNNASYENLRQQHEKILDICFELRARDFKQSASGIYVPVERPFELLDAKEEFIFEVESAALRRKEEIPRGVLTVIGNFLESTMRTAVELGTKLTEPAVKFFENFPHRLYIQKHPISIVSLAMFENQLTIASQSPETLSAYDVAAYPEIYLQQDRISCGELGAATTVLAPLIGTGDKTLSFKQLCRQGQGHINYVRQHSEDAEQSSAFEFLHKNLEKVMSFIQDARRILRF